VRVHDRRTVVRDLVDVLLRLPPRMRLDSIRVISTCLVTSRNSSPMSRRESGAQGGEDCRSSLPRTDRPQPHRGR
jgi:hypothetical protein